MMWHRGWAEAHPRCRDAAMSGRDSGSGQVQAAGAGDAVAVAVERIAHPVGDPRAYREERPALEPRLPRGHERHDIPRRVVLHVPEAHPTRLTQPARAPSHLVEDVIAGVLGARRVHGLAELHLNTGDPPPGAPSGGQGPD